MHVDTHTHTHIYSNYLHVNVTGGWRILDPAGYVIKERFLVSHEEDEMTDSLVTASTTLFKSFE